jgi:hypothetical protein
MVTLFQFVRVLVQFLSAFAQIHRGFEYFMSARGGTAWPVRIISVRVIAKVDMPCDSGLACAGRPGQRKSSSEHVRPFFVVFEQ